MIEHINTNTKQLRALMRQQEISMGGNRKLKIYGTLKCRSGKRMRRANRVFFESEKEAIEREYRPCGHCMREAYLKWRILRK